MKKESLVETIIDRANAALWYHTDTKIVHHELRRFVTGTELREILTRGVEVFEQRGACKWLSDDRGNGPLHPDDAAWAVNTWAPRVMAAGWKYWAVVMPRKVLGQMNMRQWIDMYAEKGVTVRAFDAPSEAIEWLVQQ